MQVYLIKTNMILCDECDRLACLFREECDAYDNYTENLCDSCAKYCNLCDRYYGESGSYHHDDCHQTDSEDETS